MELSIIQWVGVAALVVYAAYRTWPSIKAKLPTKKASVAQPWERERVMFNHICELTQYFNDRGESKAADALLPLLPLLMKPPKKKPEEVPDETV